MSKNIGVHLEQIKDNFKFIYTEDLHKKMYKSCGGSFYENKKNGKSFINIDKKIFPDFKGDQKLEEAESIFNTIGSLRVGKTYLKVTSKNKNNDTFYIIENDINKNYKFDTVDGEIKTLKDGTPIVSQIKK